MPSYDLTGSMVHNQINTEPKYNIKETALKVLMVTLAISMVTSVALFNTWH